MGDQITRRTSEVLTGQTARYHCFPLLAGAGVAGIPLTVGAGPGWSAAYGGAWTTIANAAGADIVTEFWAVGLYAYTGTVGAGIYEIQMTSAAAPANIAAVWAELKLDATAATLNFPLLEFGPYPLWMPAGALVAARIGGTVIQAISVHLYYAITL